MWRLLAFILACLFFLGFIVFNLENKSNVSFGFWTFSEIPVFLTAFSSFVLGMLFAVPFVLFFGRKKKASHDSLSAGENELSERKKWWGSKKENCLPDAGEREREAASSVNEVKKENSPYGID